MRSTDFGFWGAASVFTLVDVFNKVQLHKYDNFLDLGSGDGDTEDGGDTEDADDYYGTVD